ncbi:MAG TPA: tetratricopeptide repeat protein, partial [Candidatus Eremiobacteraeota bacterium]|nr:tetratricopeptide repeat protein [Candidatus Eremiobacteraeota bacterium]
MNNLLSLLCIVLSFLCFISWTWYNPFKSSAREGNDFYREGKYDEALKKYTEAQVEDPDSSDLHYNMGNVFYKKEEYEKAMEEYKKSITNSDKVLDQSSYYNMGNSYYKMDNLEDAIKSYINALKLNPHDEDSKFNLEMARKKMKEQQENSQKQQQNQQENSQKQQQNQQEN